MLTRPDIKLLLVKASADKVFRRRFIANPIAAATALGVALTAAQLEGIKQLIKHSGDKIESAAPLEVADPILKLTIINPPAPPPQPPRSSTLPQEDSEIG